MRSVLPTLRRGAALSLIAGLVRSFGSEPMPAHAHADFDIVERESDAIVARRPADPEAFMERALVLRVAGDWDGALAALERAAELHAEPIQIEAARGQVFLDAGWPRMAKLEFDRALARDPGAAGVRYDRGRAWMMLGHPDAAATDFATALADLPEPRPEQYFAWRDAQRAVGRNDEALRALDVGMARLGPAISLQLAALDLAIEIAAASGQWQDALRRADVLLAGEPRNEAWIARRGEILERAGRNDEARREYARALQLIEARPPARRGSRLEDLGTRLRTTLASASRSSAAHPNQQGTP